jgi:hypothetical protein
VLGELRPITMRTGSSKRADSRTFVVRSVPSFFTTSEYDGPRRPSSSGAEARTTRSTHSRRDPVGSPGSACQSSGTPSPTYVRQLPSAFMV